MGNAGLEETVTAENCLWPGSWRGHLALGTSVTGILRPVSNPENSVSVPRVPAVETVLQGGWFPGPWLKADRRALPATVNWLRKAVLSSFSPEVGWRGLLCWRLRTPPTCRDFRMKAGIRVALTWQCSHKDL